MTDLPNLDQHPDRVGMGTTKRRHIRSNARDRLITASEQGVVEVDCSAGGTVVLTINQQQENGLIKLTGTPAGAFNVEVFDGDRRLEFKNITGQTSTIDTATGAASPEAIPDGKTRIINIYDIELVVSGLVGLQSGALLHSGAISPTGNINFVDFLITRAEIKDVAVTVTSPASSSGTLVLDLENGNAFDVTLTEDVTTLTLDNPPATGKVGTITLIARQDGTGGHDITWPASVVWNKDVTSKLQLEESSSVLLLEDGTGGILLEPSEDSVQFTDADSISIYTLKTFNAGTTWYAIIAGADMR